MKDRTLVALRQIVFVITVFLTVVLLLRLYEFYMVAEKIDVAYNVLSGMRYDVIAALSFGAIICIPATLLLSWNFRVGYTFLVGVCGLYIMGTFALIQYFSVTLLPLGADFFGYSWSDIKTTVSSSGGLNVTTVIFLIFYPGLFIALCYLPARQKLINKIPNSVGIVALLTMFFFFVTGIRASNDSYKNDLEYYACLNKSDFFIQRASRHFYGSTEHLSYSDYPFLHPIKSDNALGAYFNLKDSMPNIVFILVEGLGRDFTCEGAQYGGFTPFLDSLAEKSLFWKNTLSNAGRTFGVLPSVLGSLPYGKEGFMSYGTEMPAHHTIISLLQPYGYTSDFFYGGNANFDNQDIFLESQEINYILDETKFPSSYSKMEANSQGFTWGYADRDVFNRSLEILSERKVSPRVDVYLTLSTHEPFRVPENSFKTLFDSRIKSIAVNKQKTYTTYRNIFECLLYTDHALKEYFVKVANLPEYNNTIFVITGDHRLIPVPAANKLSRFHVPLMIYSPMLKKAETFENIITHADVTPAILNLLHSKYKIKLPDSVAFISSSQMVSQGFSSSLDLALIRNKNETLDYIEGKYMLSENRLFEITSSMELEPLIDPVKLERLSKKINAFVGKSLFACEQNQLIKETTGRATQVFTFTGEEKEYLENTQPEKLNSDLLYLKARELAFEKKYFESRTLSRYILNKSPNYHDARILLARTFAWNGNYDTARFFLQQVLERSPNYEDALMASIDIEYWSGNHKKALSLSQVLSNKNVNADIKAREARSLFMVGKKKEAEKMLNQILQTDPEHQLSLDLLIKLQ